MTSDTEYWSTVSRHAGLPSDAAPPATLPRGRSALDFQRDVSSLRTMRQLLREPTGKDAQEAMRACVLTHDALVARAAELRRQADQAEADASKAMQPARDVDASAVKAANELAAVRRQLDAAGCPNWMMVDEHRAAERRRVS